MLGQGLIVLDSIPLRHPCQAASSAAQLQAVPKSRTQPKAVIMTAVGEVAPVQLTLAHTILIKANNLDKVLPVDLSKGVQISAFNEQTGGLSPRCRCASQRMRQFANFAALGKLDRIV